MQNEQVESYSALELRQLEKLQAQFSLSRAQVLQISDYADFVLAENKNVNLTGYREKSQVLSSLFADSLWAGKFIDFNKLSSICDVGTGAGFPGLALKIAFPHLKVFLIELTTKKVEFLRKVIERYNLQDVEIVSIDWRTFNRKTNFNIDLFLSKAAFGELEIVRMFRGNCNYQDKRLIYWASSAWQCDPLVEEFAGKTFNYKQGCKNMTLVEFKNVKK